jgi:hypothetical protein
VADYKVINYVLLHAHSLFSFHSASSEAYTPFFQIGVVIVIVIYLLSMYHVQVKIP